MRAVEAISREGALIQAAADGDALAWASSAPLGRRGGRQPQARTGAVALHPRSERRLVLAATSRTPHDSGEGYNPGEETEYRAFSQPICRWRWCSHRSARNRSNIRRCRPQTSEKTIYGARRSDR